MDEKKTAEAPKAPGAKSPPRSAVGGPGPRKGTHTVPGHLDDIRIGICRGVGLSREDTATACGVSVPTVDIRKNEDTAKEWEEWATGLMEMPSVNHKAHMEHQMIRRAQKALHSIDRAMDSDDPDLALRGSDRVLDRVLPKTQKVETTSEITERHVVELPEATLTALKEFAAAVQPKRLAAGAEPPLVYEAHVIDVSPEE